MLLCENHTAAVVNIWFMKDLSDKFVTCSEDGTIRLWDSNNYSVIARCVAPQSSSTAVGIMPLCAISPMKLLSADGPMAESEHFELITVKFFGKSTTPTRAE